MAKHLNLKRCPFCNRLTGVKFSPTKGVGCTFCQYWSGLTIIEWNRRPYEEELERETQLLKELIDDAIFYVADSDYDTAELAKRMREATGARK